MLTPEIPPDIHQLDRIKRTSAAPGRRRGVRCFTSEGVFDGHEAAAIRRSVADIEVVAYMNEETDVHILEVSVSHKKSLGSQKLFCDSGPEHQRAGQLLAFHDLLHGKRGGDVQRDSGIVTFAMARSAFNDGIVIGDSRFLRGLWNSINVTAERDDGLAGSPSRCPGCRDSRDTVLYLKTIFLEDVGEVMGGLEFLEAELAIAEYLIDHLSREISHLLDFCRGFLLE